VSYVSSEMPIQKFETNWLKVESSTPISYIVPRQWRP